MPHVVQSIILNREFFTPKEALEWIRQHGYVATKIDITPNFYRFRQVDPSALASYRFRSLPMGDVGKLIVAYP